MSDPLEIAAGERGLVRVFALPPVSARPDVADVAAALGQARLDPAQVDMVLPGDLSGLGLSGYLVDGLGIEGLGTDAARLDAVTAPVAVVRSAAFSGPGRLVLGPETTLLGAYTEAQAPGALPDPMGATVSPGHGVAAPVEDAPESATRAGLPRGIVPVALALAALVSLGVALWLGGDG